MLSPDPSIPLAKQLDNCRRDLERSETIVSEVCTERDVARAERDIYKQQLDELQAVLVGMLKERNAPAPDSDAASREKVLAADFKWSQVRLKDAFEDLETARDELRVTKKELSEERARYAELATKQIAWLQASNDTFTLLNSNADSESHSDSDSYSDEDMSSNGEDDCAPYDASLSPSLSPSRGSSTVDRDDNMDDEGMDDMALEDSKLDTPSQSTYRRSDRDKDTAAHINLSDDPRPLKRARLLKSGNRTVIDDSERVDTVATPFASTEGADAKKRKNKNPKLSHRKNKNKNTPAAPDYGSA